TFVCEGKASARTILCRAGVVREIWAKAQDAEVNIFAAWGWFNVIGRIVSVDPAEAIIRIEGRECQYPIREGNRFFVENVREELDAPGEWYLDSLAGRLYYWPREGSPDGKSVVAPVLNTLIHLQADVDGQERVQHVHLRGFTLSHTDYTTDHVSVRTAQDATALLENAWHCSVERCRFVNVGGSAIRLHLDSRHNLIADNEVTQAGGNGVLLTAAVVDRGLLMTPGEAAAKVAPIQNTLTRNHVHHCGQIHKYVAGVHMDSRPRAMAGEPGNVVSHNHIHHMPRNGIFGFEHQGGNVLEHNRIHHVMLESDDGGGIHICQDNTACAPTVIRHNVIHDVFGARVDKDGRVSRQIGIGVYLDGATSSCHVTSNVICRTSMGAVFLHGGQDNIVENNILLGDHLQQFWVSNYTQRMSGNRFRRNIVQCLDPDAKAMKLMQFTPETLAECDQNLYWHGGQPIAIDPIGTLADWQQKGYDARSLVADPQFADPAHDDYSLKPGSPALELGFVPISKIKDDR
ncbi:MAG: right-handed parallel beta-helix repeat-containing protein, partial [Planctomycetes bacterium]|nr:right-handed parallel beta-helix repeat-containing protein [Planctomycetota bacterium]